MNWKFLYIVFFYHLFISVSQGQNEKKYQLLTVAFYNLENLFDYEDDPNTFDDDRTPEGKDHWTETDYRNKLQQMAKVLVQIGSDTSQKAPALIGLCEIENRRVLEDLVSTPPLNRENYGIVHYDSPDLRGVDVALLYKKGWFVPVASKAYELKLKDSESGKRIYTRDQLLVSGLLDGELIYIIVNHWPSRRGGESRSAYKRIQAARLNKHISDSLLSQNPYAKILSMGDFNDDPIDAGFKKILKSRKKRRDTKLKEWYNPMETMFEKGMGSLAYGDSWNLFDQILLTQGWISEDYSSFQFYKAGIYNPPFLQQSTGRYKGYPYKSFTEGRFGGGYSDHFPVYIYLVKEKISD